MLKIILKDIIFRISVVLGVILVGAAEMSILDKFGYSTSVIIAIPLVTFFIFLFLVFLYTSKSENIEKIKDKISSYDSSVEINGIEKESSRRKENLDDFTFAEPSIINNAYKIYYRDHEFEFYEASFSVGISLGPIAIGKGGGSPIKFKQDLIYFPCSDLIQNGDLYFYPSSFTNLPIINFIVKKSGVFSNFKTEFGYFYDSDLPARETEKILNIVEQYKLPEPYIKFSQQGIKLYYLEKTMSSEIIINSLKAIGKISNSVNLLDYPH